jgi:hemerythrin-like domain-containing protein
MMSLPVQTLNRCYSDLLEICDILEAIADSLPYNVSTKQCADLAAEFVDLLERTHRQEEALLLPFLASSPRPELRQLAKRLREEHDYDDDVVVEVREALLAIATHRPLQSADATGYLLRSFFESLRRHVRAEQDLLAIFAEFTPPGGTKN